MDVAASGGYYLSLPADYIIAHPTTITGSVGAIFIYPKFNGLLDKIGLKVEVSKSGKNKDMGSPFRDTTAEERELLQELTDTIGKRFLNLVAQHRKLEAHVVDHVATARVFTAQQALDLGLIDEIGYLTDAINSTKKLAGLPDGAKVVVYRRAKFPDDNLYNTATTQSDIYRFPFVDLNLISALPDHQVGIYYLWAPAGK
jgi:protease-4